MEAGVVGQPRDDVEGEQQHTPDELHRVHPEDVCPVIELHQAEVSDDEHQALTLLMASKISDIAQGFSR